LSSSVDGTAQRLELREHLLHLAMVVLENLDHVALLVAHSCLLGRGSVTEIARARSARS
jgi:hypothetical protein